MNWNPLRKLSILNQPQSDPSTKNANVTLDRLIIEFDSVDKITQSLAQSTRKLTDEILCAAKFEFKLIQELTGAKLFETEKITANILEDWNSFASQSNHISDEYVVHLQRSLLDPIKKLKQTFKELRTAIRSLEATNLNMLKYQRRVAEYSTREKTGTNLVKLEENRQALTVAQSEFARNSQNLVNDLAQLLSGGVEMLRPLFEGFMAAEIAWIQASKRSLDEKANLVNSVESESLAERLKKIEEVSKSISSLSICLDSK